VGAGENVESGMSASAHLASSAFEFVDAARGAAARGAAARGAAARGAAARGAAGVVDTLAFLAADGQGRRTSWLAALPAPERP